MSPALEPDERDVQKVLTLLATESRVYRLPLQNAQPVIERLASDLDDTNVASLLTSLTIMLAEPPRLATPRHVEQLALAIFRELRL